MDAQRRAIESGLVFPGPPPRMADYSADLFVY
jgi:hypothetical protein